MNERITPANIKRLKINEVFVFGSNPEGFHTHGAARTAIQWGAIMGKGIGLYGNTYAIPTTFQTVKEIEPYTSEFIQFAKSHPEYIFFVTEIGCGYAGHQAKDIAPLFKEAVNIENICLPDLFRQILNNCFSDRLKSIMSHYSLTPMSFMNSIGLKPTYVMNLVFGIEYPTIDAIQKILIQYPEVNARWLLLGEGSLSEKESNT